MPKPPIKQKYIETPEKLWSLFTEYRLDIKANPILKHDFVGGLGKSVERKIQRPLTMEGFENYCFDAGLIADLKDYFANTRNAYTSYTPICSRIRDKIRQDQIEGGMAGIYNPSITQRLNGLTEKTDNKNENTNKNFDVTLDLK